MSWPILERVEFSEKDSFKVLGHDGHEVSACSTTRLYIYSTVQWLRLSQGHWTQFLRPGRSKYICGLGVSRQPIFKVGEEHWQSRPRVKVVRPPRGEVEEGSLEASATPRTLSNLG